MERLGKLRAKRSGGSISRAPEIEAAMEAWQRCPSQISLLTEIPEATPPQPDGPRTWGSPPVFDFAPGPTGSSVASRSALLDLPTRCQDHRLGFSGSTRSGRKLVRALANFMLDLHTREHGYVEVAPPYLVNRASMTGTGQLPNSRRSSTPCRRTSSFLIPTARSAAHQPLSRRHPRGRRPPGGYVRLAHPVSAEKRVRTGGHARGLIRIHQFDKVELVRFCRPEDYRPSTRRIARPCGDGAATPRAALPRSSSSPPVTLGFASARTYDLEVWAAGLGTWLEVSSASTFTDFQARRANIRVIARPQGQTRIRAYPQCIRAGRSPHDHRAAGEQPDGGWLGPDPCRARAVPRPGPLVSRA